MGKRIIRADGISEFESQLARVDWLSGCGRRRRDDRFVQIVPEWGPTIQRSGAPAAAGTPAACTREHHPDAWALALRLANTNAKRLRVVPLVEIIVANWPRNSKGAEITNERAVAARTAARLAATIAASSATQKAAGARLPLHGARGFRADHCHHHRGGYR
jgi:hypothetical protein